MKVKVIFALFTALALTLSSCHSSRRTVRGSQGRSHRTERPATGPQRPGSGQQKLSGNRKRLIEHAYTWIGTPYLYGGNDSRGVDCSGFVCAVFARTTSVKLPRSSREIAEFVSKIPRDSMEPGDLVFFTSKAGGSRINHVAIYVGDNQIIHSTTSRGVIVSNLDDNYWRTHYHRCGRVSQAWK